MITAPFLKKHLSPWQWTLLTDSIMHYELNKWLKEAIPLVPADVRRKVKPAAKHLNKAVIAHSSRLSNAFYSGKFPVDLAKTRLFNICVFFLWLKYDQDIEFTPDSDLPLPALNKVMKKCRIYSCGQYGVGTLDIIYKELFKTK